MPNRNTIFGTTASLSAIRVLNNARLHYQIDLWPAVPRRLPSESFLRSQAPGDVFCSANVMDTMLHKDALGLRASRYAITAVWDNGQFSLLLGLRVRGMTRSAKQK